MIREGEEDQALTFVFNPITFAAIIPKRQQLIVMPLKLLIKKIDNDGRLSLVPAVPGHALGDRGRRPDDWLPSSGR